MIDMLYSLYTLNNEFTYRIDEIPDLFTGIVRYNTGFDYSVTTYYLNGAVHRVDGPSIIVTNSDGSPGSESWRNKGLLHRVGGPAYHMFDHHKEWYIGGNKVTELEHDLLVDVMKLRGLL